MKKINYLYNILKRVSSTAYGKILLGLGAVYSFLAPELYAFTIVLVAIIIDAIFGIAVSKKYGRFALSRLGRVTLFKITSYMSALLMVFMVEKLAHDNGFIGIKIAAGCAVACEFWSFSASVLILWPKAAFFKILRHQLRDEIASKIGPVANEVLKY